MKGRVVALLVGGALIATAVLIRVWLAATGGYSGGSLAISLRVVSAVSLVAGFLLAGASVAWPVKSPGSQANTGDSNTP